MGKAGEASMNKREASEIVFINNFKSKILNNERDIAIYLPPDYKNINKRYPVLYMHDGQNLFTCIDGGSNEKWRVQETTDKLILENKIEEVIIVGIYNTEDRISEYTDSYMDKYKAGGKGADYSRFVATEVKPYIDNNFRTLKDRENTAIAGSSLGGLISFYIGWNYPETFKKIGAISSSFWWASNKMQKQVEAYNGVKKELNIWIDAGNAEENSDRNNNGIIDMVDDARDMVYALIKKGFTLYKDVMYYEATSGMHNEASWADRLDQILLYMFSKEKSPTHKALEAEGLDNISINTKDAMYLNAVVTYSNGLKQTLLDVRFSTENKDIIKLDSKGFIIPLKEGKAEVSADGLGLSAKKIINIKK